MVYPLRFSVNSVRRYNREKESKMAVAKRQGREKPLKIEQKKVQDWNEDLR